jgi:hypothetical protein
VNLRLTVMLGWVATVACTRSTAPTVAALEAGTPGSFVDAAALVAPPADAGAALIDLLHFTPASVAVSSNVNNPRDFPEHLIDGDPGTAWNSRTGDLAGGWIKFRVPEEARVERIEMTVGFDKIGPEGDLFSMNHRIKRIRVVRGDTVLREHTFAVDERGLQAVPVGARGGTFRIDILETVPGTLPKWRELCVSELRVVGDPGPVRFPTAAMPLVGVGMLPHEAAVEAREMVDLLGRRWNSLKEFCVAWDAKVGPMIDPDRRNRSYMPPRPDCTSKGQLLPDFVPALGVAALTSIALHTEDDTEDRFAIETDAGVYVPNVEPLERHPYNDPGCFGGNDVKIRSATVGGPGVVIELEDSWGNTHGFQAEDGSVSFTSEDDIQRIRLDCAPAPQGWTCTRKVLSRVCHAMDKTVPCDSF